jgi:peptidoglycan-associated lipoprotein
MKTCRRKQMRTRSLILLVSSAALSACSKKAPEALPPAPADTAPPVSSAPTPTPSGPTPGSQADFVASVTADRVFFGTDKSDIDDESRNVLRSQAEWLQRYPQKRITLEGHCDERGTREYNLALGERRANAAKNYLAALGIDPTRITTISYGKERPAAVGSDEASWAQNRRAVTITVD